MSNPEDTPKLNDLNGGMKEEMESRIEKKGIESPTKKKEMSPAEKMEKEFPVEKKEMKSPEPEQKVMKSSENEETKPPEKEEIKSPEKEEIKSLQKEETKSANEKTGIMSPKKIMEKLSPENKKEEMSPEKIKEKISSETKKEAMTSEKTVENLSQDKKEQSDDFETLFDLYANFGDRDGANGITIKNIEKWFTQADLLSDKLKEKLTKADITKCFSVIAIGKERIKLQEFKVLVQALAKEKSVTERKMEKMLIDAGRPKISGVSDLLSTICRPCC